MRYGISSGGQASKTPAEIIIVLGLGLTIPFCLMFLLHFTLLLPPTHLLKELIATPLTYLLAYALPNHLLASTNLMTYLMLQTASIYRTE